jgi:hypothetical protein
MGKREKGFSQHRPAFRGTDFIKWQQEATKATAERQGSTSLVHSPSGYDQYEEDHKQDGQ